MLQAVTSAFSYTDFSAVDTIYAVAQLFPLHSGLSRLKNCIDEAQDLLKDWPCDRQYDLVHIRNLTGSLTEANWNVTYRPAYE